MADKIQTELVPIEEMIFKGLKQRIHEVFGCPIAFDNSTDEIQAIRKLQQQTGVQYPYMFLSLSSLNRSTDAWRSTPFIRRGVNIVLANNKQVLNIAMVPVDFVCDVTYKDNDFSRVKNYAIRWLMSVQSGYLKFTVNYGQLFPIHIILGDDVPTPKREANAENIQEYTVITQLTVKGWMSEAKAREQPVYTEVEFEAFAGKEKFEAPANSQFFEFKR